MKILKLFPASLFLLSFVILACGTDPWIQGGNPVDTDKVVITKVTAYGTQKDGVSPYKGQVGAVTMSHKVHEDQGLACIDCHHKEIKDAKGNMVSANDARTKQCAVCHNGQAGYNTMHGLCVDCHIKKGKGPQQCMECH